MENFLVLGLFVGLGVLFRHIKAFPEQTAQALNMFALYVALPAVVLLKVPQIEFSGDILLPAIVPWLLLLVSALLVFWAAGYFQWPRETVGVLLLVVPIGNTSFMGVPMVNSFFGELGIPHLIIYDQLGTMLIFAIYGSIVLAVYGGDVKLKATGIFLRAVLFPPTLALIVGLMLRFWEYPDIVVSGLTTLSGMLTPLVMTAIGFQLRIRLSPSVLGPMGFGLTVKLILTPLMTLLGCRLLGFDGLITNVTIFEAGMPPMVTSGALAIAAGLFPELAAATVSLGMALAFISLPVLYWLM